MTGTRLSKKVVEELTPKSRDYIVWCSALSGFGVRVWPSGKKTFVAMYRVAGRRTAPKKYKIGVYGDPLTVEQARERAKEVLANAKLGKDAAELRAAERKRLSLNQLCDEYLQFGVESKKPTTLKSDFCRINAHIRPRLGTRIINDIGERDIRQFLKEVATPRVVGKWRHGKPMMRGGKGTATRTVRLLGGIFTYAKRQGYLERNPVQGVRLFPDAKNQRYLDADEFKKLGEALRVAETQGLPWQVQPGNRSKHLPKNEANRREVLSPHVAAAFRLLILTGCRLREILHLRWTEVDFKRGILNFPDSKTGAKQLVVAASVMTIIESLPRTSQFVIAGEQTNRPRADLNRPWRRLTTFAGLEGLRIHDLRHSFASAGVEQGLGLIHIGKLLGHRDAATTQRYAHLGDDPLRRAADIVAGSLADAIRPAHKPE
jgi:integrase